MKSDTNGLFDMFLAKIFFLNEKFTDPTFSPGIVQFEVANYSAECVFPVFAVKTSIFNSVFMKAKQQSPSLPVAADIACARLLDSIVGTY